MSEATAAAISTIAQELGLSVGVAESLTGGLLANALAVAPDASVWFKGSLVAYSAEVKQHVLGVSPGPVVTERCAAEMALGALKTLEADVTVAVTGVGGPDPEEGQPPGTVWFAVTAGEEPETRRMCFEGGPAEVCRATVEVATEMLLAALRRTGRAGR